MKPLQTVAALLAAGTLALLSQAGIAASEVAGIKLDDTATVANQRLVLNGAGIRTRAIFKVYVAALYLPQKKETLKDIVALPGAKRVAVVMLREVSSEDLSEALITGIRKNSTAEETRRFASPLMKMSDIFNKIPKLKKGESFSIDWVPGSGTVVLVDGKSVAEPIADQTFYDAILRIWLGDDPADSDLKPAMLGTK